MDITSVIEKIISIPRNLRTSNQSPYALLKGSGYFDIYDQITVADIFQAIDQDIKYVEEWMDYSDDKRTDQGWLFMRWSAAKYVVRFFSVRKGNMDYKPDETFADPFLACAALIKYEIESIRKNYLKTRSKKG